MTTVFKAIKPKRLKDDALRLHLLNEMRKYGNVIKKDFEATTDKWEGEKPKWEVLVSLQKGTTVAVSSNGPAMGVRKWDWMDKGTKAHDIRPKKPGGSLVFRDTFTAKTVPGVIGSRAGGSSGNLVIAKKVRHPGTKARRIEAAIKKRHEPRFKRAMELAMKEAAKKSGHSI